MPDQHSASRLCTNVNLRSKLSKFVQKNGYISTILVHLILLAFGVSAVLGKWWVTKHTILPLCESVFIVYKVFGVCFIILISIFPDTFVCPMGEGNKELVRDSTRTGQSYKINNESPENNIEGETTSADNDHSFYGSLSNTFTRPIFSPPLGKSNLFSASEPTSSHIKDNIPLMGILFFVILVCFVNILEMFPRLDCIHEYKLVKEIDHRNFTSSMYKKSVFSVANSVTWTIFAIALTLFCCKIIYGGKHLYTFWPVRLGLAQLLATLLTIWCDYQLRESQEILQYSDADNCDMMQLVGNISIATINCVCKNTSMYETLEHNASEYILPVNVEFCMLVTENLVHILLSLKAKKEPNKNTNEEEELNKELGSEDVPSDSHYTPQPIQMENFNNLLEENVSEERKSLLEHPNQLPQRREGKNIFNYIIYIVTFLICLIYLVLKIIISRGIGDSRKRFWTTFTHVYEACLWAVSIIVSIWGIIIVFQKFKFKSVQKHTGFEMVMILSAFGFYLHASLSLIAAFSTRMNETDPTKIMYINILIVTRILDGLQISLQIVLMFKVSGKACQLAVAYRIPPHSHLKCVIIYFIVLNFVIWIVDSFIERKSASEMDKLQMEFYQKSTWMTIYHITYPLMLYFRFNSFLHLSQSTLKIYF